MIPTLALELSCLNPMAISVVLPSTAALAWKSRREKGNLDHDQREERERGATDESSIVFSR